MQTFVKSTAGYCVITYLVRETRRWTDWSLLVRLPEILVFGLDVAACVVQPNQGQPRHRLLEVDREGIRVNGEVFSSCRPTCCLS